ncbi:MAG: 50S ribosomal protein L4 [Candidatus Omnitrophota bacterium]|nr:MAG: 50S ribosomal protein L4 [Candidatus Omnitrophota bacterium]
MKSKIKIPVVDTHGKKKDTLDLDVLIFDGKVRQALMHQAVVSYLANQRKGLATAKTRGKVRGGGAKPWRQKGTGRARVGSIRSPLWRGGGVTFGPQPRPYYKNLPKKMKALALQSALNVKLKDNEMTVLNNLDVKSHKTKDFSRIIKNLKLTDKRVRFVVDKLDNNVKLSSRNLEKVTITEAQNLTTYEALDCKGLIFTKEAILKIEGRIKKCLG